MPIVELSIDSKGALVGAKTYDQATDKIVKSTKKAEGALSRIGKGMAGFARAAAPAIAGLGAAMVGIGAKSIQLASNLEETQGKFDTVFRGMTDTAEDWSETLVDSYLMTEEASKRYLSSIQDLLVPTGIAREEAGGMANEFVKLAADLASFNNLPTEQVIGDIQSALAGSAESMTKYGVDVRKTAIEQEALNTGLANSKAEIDRAVQAQALLQIAMRESGDAIGDVARTSGSYANQMKKLKSNLETLATNIGEVLLPYALEFIEALVRWTSEEQNLNMVIEGTKTVINALKGALLIVKLAVDAVYISFAKVIKIITGGIAKMLKPFTKISKKAEELHKGLSEASKSAEHFGDAANEGFTKSFEALGDLITGQEKAKTATDNLTGSVGQLTTAGGEADDALGTGGLLDSMLNIENAAGGAAEQVQTLMTKTNAWRNETESMVLTGHEMIGVIDVMRPKVEGLGEAQLKALEGTKKDTAAKREAAQAATTLAPKNDVVAQSYRNIAASAGQAAGAMGQAASASPPAGAGGAGGGGGGTFTGRSGRTTLPSWFTESMIKQYMRDSSDTIITGTPHLPGYEFGASRTFRETRDRARREWYKNQLDPYQWAQRNGYDPGELGFTDATQQGGGGGGGVNVNINQEMSKEQIAALVAELERSQARQ